MKLASGIPIAVALVSMLAIAFPASIGAPEQAPREDASGCKAFAWSVTNERKWFADPNTRSCKSGTRLSRVDRAVDLKLERTRKAQFFLPPEKTPPADSYSGYVTFFGVPHRGLYHVTISGDASIDVFENGTRLAPTAASQDSQCQDVRKSERFALAPGDLVLVQVSGASAPRIRVAFEEAH